MTLIAVVHLKVPVQLLHVKAVRFGVVHHALIVEGVFVPIPVVLYTSRFTRRQ